MYLNYLTRIKKFFLDNLTLLRKLERENMICSKQKQKIQYDRHTRPHNFRVGDKVLIKIHRLKENEDEVSYNNNIEEFIQ